MSTQRTSDKSPFPNLEYLVIVGYFRDNIRKPAAFLSAMLSTLESELGDAICTTSGIDTLVRCRNPGPNRSGWQHVKELDDFTLLHNSCNAHELLSRLHELPNDAGLTYMMFNQPGKRSSVYRVFDHIWNITFEAAATYPHEQHDCMCIVGLSTHLFPLDYRGLTTRASTAIADKITRIMLEHGDLYYALMDANYFRADGAGWCYAQDSPANFSSVRFRIEHELWTSAGVSRREKVRGVYPGQYLSPWHLEKLGGKDAFIADLLRVLDRRNDLITDLGDKGLILRLAPTPIDATAFGLNQGFHGIARWVFCRFREAGLFL